MGFFYLSLFLWDELSEEERDEEPDEEEEEDEEELFLFNYDEEESLE